MTVSCPIATRYRILETPTGQFYLTKNAEGVVRTGWRNFDADILDDADHAPRLLEDLTQRLLRFFDGHAENFSDVPHPPGPPFQRACWRAARGIAHGETWTYAELATAAGRSGAARAAGQAMRHNPLPVVVPCHRVLASGGGLGGFAGSTCVGSSAIRTKCHLLRMEGHQIE